jgi:hypothetical protein
VVDEVDGGIVHPPGVAGGTKPALAGEGEQTLVAAGLAFQASSGISDRLGPEYAMTGLDQLR